MILLLFTYFDLIFLRILNFRLLEVDVRQLFGLLMKGQKSVMIVK
jgi:hypothetical protein